MQIVLVCTHRCDKKSEYLNSRNFCWPKKSVRAWMLVNRVESVIHKTISTRSTQMCITPNYFEKKNLIYGWVISFYLKGQLVCNFLNSKKKQIVTKWNQMVFRGSDVHSKQYQNIQKFRCTFVNRLWAAVIGQHLACYTCWL